MAKEVRLEILKGNEAGAQFKITGARVLFGRSSSCDIVITDPSVSRNHAELLKVQDGYIIRDLGSSNGVVINGQRVTEKQLRHSDIFNIGNHSYRYYELELTGRDSAKVSVPVMPSSSGTVPVFSGGGSSNKRRFIMYGGIAALLVALLVFGGKEDKKDEKKEDKKSDELTLDVEENPDYQRRVQEGMEDFYNKANEFYFEGRREYRVKNYVRALDSFKRALTFYPRHGPSREYARLAAQHIKDDGKAYLVLGKKLLAQQKYREAIKLFNDSMDLNSNNPAGEIFKEAEKMKTVAEKRLEESMR